MTPPIRTRPDGTKYPIRGGGRGGGRAALVAGGMALALWAGAGAPAGTAASAGLSAAESTVVRTITTNLSKARQDVRHGKPERAWRRLGLRKTTDRAHEAVGCAVFSYGQVQGFFARTPCRDLRRAQFTVSYDGRVVSVLVSRVRMRSSTDARRLRYLIDRHGTGDIHPVLGDVRFTGHHYDSGRDRATVFIAETEPSAGAVPDRILDVTAEAAVALAKAAS